jgi:hypothetical protein
MCTPIVRELELLQHIVPENNSTNEDENSDILTVTALMMALFNN